ncbi:hypothetical protein KW797_02010 [Candidatus Parcubacteria bacterium]|nr:hypothetical protein [Candidatus Parcubacteria bacterium]
MKKVVVDCSKPLGNPEREKLVDVAPEEKASMEAAWAEGAAKKQEEQKNRPISLEERVATLEAQMAKLTEKGDTK